MTFTIAEAAAELRKLHAEMIEASDAPDGVYSLKSHMEADVRFIRAAKDNVPALLDALERRTEALMACAESLAFTRDKLGMCGEGDGADRKADAADDIGSLPALIAARSALEPKP